jgi:23S rRNA (guanosine2251-2'-O)-methyltransferase
MNLICGVNPVLEALASGSRHFDRLLVAKGLRNRRIAEAISRASRLAIPLRFETRETLDRMAGGVPHQGLIAVVSPRPASTLEELLKTARDPALFVVLDGVEDPRNLGAILRTSEAAGVDGVLLPDRHNAGLSETVNRASAGALEHVRLARIGNVAQTLEALKERGIWIVGMDASGRERWDAVDYKRPIAVVLGGEGRGMRRLVRERCDHVCALPIFGHVSSLNVSVAAGVALYEVLRQRGAVPSHVRPIPPKAAAPPHVVGPPAGDEEEDPGAPPRAYAFEPEDEDAEDREDGEVHVVVNDEDVAWAGPTIVKHAGFRRGRPRPLGHRKGDKRRHRDRDRGDRERPRGPRRDAPPGDHGPAEPRGGGPERPEGHAGGEADRQGRGRRRRRRKGPGRPPGPPGNGGLDGRSGGSDEARGPRPESGSGGPGPDSNGTPPAGDRAHRGRRRRRRRRREPSQ